VAAVDDKVAAPRLAARRNELRCSRNTDFSSFDSRRRDRRSHTPQSRTAEMAAANHTSRASICILAARLQLQLHDDAWNTRHEHGQFGLRCPAPHQRISELRAAVAPEAMTSPHRAPHSHAHIADIPRGI